jgi:hypothetical protein
VAIALAVEAAKEARAAANPVTPREKPRARKPYQRLELEKLLWLTIGDSTEGLTDESLAEFWREFQEYRGQPVSARTFLEDYFDRVMLVDPEVKEFHLSNMLVTTFKDLRFSDRRSKGYSWALRHHGLSVFAWAPEQPTNQARNDLWAATTERLERTLENHGDADQVALDKMVGNGEDIPTTMAGVREYIKHDIHMCRHVFGPACVGLEYAQKIFALISQHRYVRAYQPLTCATLMWKYHMARMDIFHDPSALQLKLLHDKIISGEVPSHFDFQADVWVELEKASGLRPRMEEKKRAAVSNGGDNEGRQPKQGRQQSKEVMIVSTSTLAPDDTATEALLGAEGVSLYEETHANTC